VPFLNFTEGRKILGPALVTSRLNYGSELLQVVPQTRFSPGSVQ